MRIESSFDEEEAEQEEQETHDSEPDSLSNHHSQRPLLIPSIQSTCSSSSSSSSSSQHHPSDPLPPPLPSHPSNLVDEDDYHHSPRSILSWNDLNDNLSISDSSIPTHPTPSEDNHPSHSELIPTSINPADHPTTSHIHPHRLINHHSNHQPTTSPELLAAITRHLIMPRLPMIPTPSAHSSRPTSLSPQRSSSSSSSSSLPPHLNHSFHPSSFNSTTPPIPTPHSSLNYSRVLLLAHAPVAHRLGSFDSPPSSSQPQFLRIQDRLPHFRFSDPSTYPDLIDLIEGPFNRLKQILNPNLWNAYDQSSCPPDIRQDLMSLLVAWIEREGYLLLLVEIESFPLSSDKLEFVLSLSRLLPIIPYIPPHLPLSRAIDGHAILTRQFNAKRIQHFPIPHPQSTPQPWMASLPDREECLSRSSRCAFDWLTVEYASQANHRLNPRHEQALLENPQHSWHSYHLTRRLQDLEPDRWSEKVSQRITRRSKGLGLNLSSSSVEDPSSFQLARHFPAIKPTTTIDPRHQSCLSIESLGLPSLRVLIRLGIQELKRRLIELVNVSLSNRSTGSDRSSPPDHPSETRNRHHLGSHRSLGSGRRPRSSSLDRFDPSIHPLPLISHPHSDPRPSSTAAWFMIGFVTATTTAAAAAALTVWWRSGLML